MSKSKSEQKGPAADRDLYSGLIRLHVLHHAVEGPIFGLGMIEELARHGYTWHVQVHSATGRKFKLTHYRNLLFAIVFASLLKKRSLWA